MDEEVVTPQEVEFELPPEIASEPVAPVAEIVPEPTETAPGETEPKPREKVVPLKALQEEREKRKEVQRDQENLAERVERARTQYFSEQQRREAAKKAAERPKTNYNELADLNAVAEKLREEVLGEANERVQAVSSQLVSTKVKWSEQYWRDRFDDYDERLEESGVKQATTFNPATGQFHDPFLAGTIFNAEDPALFAYEYASGKLGKKVETRAREDGRREGRKEVVEQVRKVATRPVNFGKVAGSSASRQTFRLADITAMTDNQQRWIKKNRPEVWEQYQRLADITA